MSICLKRLCWILGTAGLLAVSASAEERKWTSSDGKSFKGVMLSSDATSVRVQRSSDRQQFSIPFDQLKKADLDYVKQQAATKFLRLQATPTKTNTQHKQRVTGTRRVRRRKVKIVEHYTLVGKGVRVNARTTSSPFKAKVEVIFVNHKGNSKKVFKTENKSISVSKSDTSFEVRSGLTEHFYGWAVVLRHADSGKVLAVIGSTKPLEDFARQRAKR